MIVRLLIMPMCFTADHHHVDVLDSRTRSCQCVLQTMPDHADVFDTDNGHADVLDSDHDCSTPDHVDASDATCFF